MDSPLVETTKIFLTPASILFGALGVAKTEGLKAGISGAGVLIAALWIGGDNVFGGLKAQHVLGYLPIIFLIAWMISLYVHLPRHLAYKRREKRAVRRDEESKLIELDVRIAHLFEADEVNRILLAYVPAQVAEVAGSAANAKKP